jgi:hypothetical protein
MCLAPAIIDERTDRLSAFLAATGQLVAANMENGEQKYSGILLLLTEIEKDLASVRRRNF